MTNIKSNRAFYNSDFRSFIEADPNYILGTIHTSMHGHTMTTSDEAWIEEIQLLQDILYPWKDEEADIIFEYDIPRLGKRIDVVLLLRGVIFCLEFKVGQKDALRTDVDQVMDYALDLKNFHRYSHDRIIVPILIPTKHKTATTTFSRSVYDDTIFNPLISGSSHLNSLIERVLTTLETSPGTIKDWVKSPYAPTPTIIEAARRLYENHSVEDITRHEADNVSTDATIKYVLDVIAHSKEHQEKSICFVTGVPGAGKTLVGLEVAVRQSYHDNGDYNKEDGAVYLSGNGPLVAVLTEALARDNQKKIKAKGEKKNITDSRREVRKFIQIIHRYRDNMLAKIKEKVENGKLEFDPDYAVKDGDSGYAEVEHVAIFDEAQRAWTKPRIANYLARGGTYGNKRKIQNFPMSEASFLIWSLDQRKDWATIVCLIGGGQEINTGEAGISEWIEALNNQFDKWKVYISPKLTEPEYAEGKVNDLLKDNPNVTFSDKLHLNVSVRSFRAERLSTFVHSLLSFDHDTNELYEEVMKKNYPVVLTRSMEKARKWLVERATNNVRTGVLISKVSARFKPLAVHVLPSSDDNAVHWFLEDTEDTRSSNYLEDAATEIQVQGLELDYTCVLWDADMRYKDGKWEFWKFWNNRKWIRENNIENQKYMLNAYRVLLTRARQGIVICVPEGNDSFTPNGYPVDSTRLPEFYDSTYEYFKSIGIKEI